MDDAIGLASSLGKAIAANPLFGKLRDVEKQVSEDPKAQELVKSYGEQMEKIRRLESELKPVEVADKHLLDELHGHVASHPVLKELARAQADFADFMNRVNRAIDRELMPVSDAPD